MRDLHATTAATFAQNQLVRAFQETCAPRQRALLSLLAICKKHDLDPAQMVASLSQDLPRTFLESGRKTRNFYWSRVQDFSEELKQFPAIPDGLEKFPDLLPNTVELALRLAREQGTLDELNDAWLNRPPDYVFDATQNESFVARMFPLFLKAFIILFFASFLMIFIVPEFMAMLEEFDVAVPPIFQLTVTTVGVIIRYVFVPVLIFLIAIPCCIPSWRRYFKRWNPFVWQQPILPSTVSTRRGLALIAAHGRSTSTDTLTGFPILKRVWDRSSAETKAVGDRHLDWQRLASQKIISGKEAHALEMADSGAVQAWLLQKSAIMRNHRIESRGLFFTRAVVTTVNVILGTLVLLLALSVISALISIMSHLS